MNPAEIARKALKVLDEDGWCKGSVNLNKNSPFTLLITDGAGTLLDLSKSQYPNGSHCLGGAWNIALHGKPHFLKDQGDSYEPLVLTIFAQYPEIADLGLDRLAAIMNFNDRSEITEDDVRAILEKIACS